MNFEYGRALYSARSRQQCCLLKVENIYDKVVPIVQLCHSKHSIIQVCIIAPSMLSVREWPASRKELLLQIIVRNDVYSWRNLAFTRYCGTHFGETDLG